MLQISRTCFNPTQVPVASDSISLRFLLGGENIYYYFVKSIASFRCIEDTSWDTPVQTLAHDRYSPARARWLSRKLRPKSKNNSVFAADCFKKFCRFVDSYGLLTKCEVKMAGYWPSSFFACLWTETKSRSINSQKKNEANIQPSWPNKLGQ